MRSTNRRATIWQIWMLAFILSACSAVGDAGSLPTELPTQHAVEVSTPTPVPTQEGEYTSPLYGYSLKLPEGWNLSASATRLLTSGELPEAGFPMVDTFRGPERRNIMVVAAQPVSSTTTLDGWADYVANMTTDCERPPTDQTMMELGGEPAKVVVDGSCFGINHLWLALVHEGRGYHVVWLGDREYFEQVRKSFTFNP